METDNPDPIDWTTDEVVKFLCNPESALWASSINAPRPDPVALEASLRENIITGEVLLHDVDNNTLRDDLGVKLLGHRSSVLRAIKWLQNRSRKYKLSQDDASPKNLSNMPSTTLSTSSTAGALIFDPHHVPDIGQSPPRKEKKKRRIAPTLIKPGTVQASAQAEFNSTPVGASSDFPGAENISPLHGPSGDRFHGIHGGHPETPTQSVPFGTVSNANADERFYSYLIEKYAPKEDEETLPCYGDSGSEAEYDAGTWREIVQDNPNVASHRLPPEECESIISSRIAHYQEIWRREELPILLSGASVLWANSRKGGAFKHMMEKNSMEIDRLTHRLSVLKREITVLEHVSQASLKRACVNLEQTVFQICLQKWELSVLEQEQCPQPVSLPVKAVQRLEARSSLEEEERADESPASESDLATDDDISDGESVDFIVSDSESVDKIDRSAAGPSEGLPFTLASSPPSDSNDSSQPTAKRRRLSVGHRIQGDFDVTPPPGGIDIVDLTSPVAMAETTSTSSPEIPAHSEMLHEDDTTEEFQIETPLLNPIAQEAIEEAEIEPAPLDLGFSEGSQPMELGTSPEMPDNLSLDEAYSPSDLRIETPPLNPVASAVAEDTDVDEGLMVKTPPLNPQPPLRLKISQPQPPSSDSNPNSPTQTRRRSKSLSKTPTSAGSTHNFDSEYADLFETVAGISMRQIESSQNRLHLLAKTVMGLRPGERREYPAYLRTCMDCIYQDTVHSAIIAMMQNKRELENEENDGGQLGMRLGALFVSWFHCISLTPDGMPKEQLRQALRSIENDDPLTFTAFLDKLRDLVAAYNELHPLEVVSRKSPELDSEDNVSEPYDSTSIGQPPRRKKKKQYVPRALSNVQKRAQERVVKQAKAMEVFRKAREMQGLSNNDPAGQAVAFKEPIIYLPPTIGEFVKPHQLKGIQFMWRELCEADKPQGCLLAHVMGLGKTMQVISFLVTVSEAAASGNPQIRAQVPRKFHRSQTLVLCPSSLVQNWIDEFAIWTPENHHLGPIREIIPRGKPTDAEERLALVKNWNEEGGVLILSYDILRVLIVNKGRYNEEDQKLIDEALLSKPNIVIADEAHKLKGEKSVISQVASRFRTMSRIAITGSPLANSLFEYYQMLEWTAPGYLEDIGTFKEKFIKPIQAGSYIDSTQAQRRESLVALKLLNGILNPKIQRADTSVIAQDLPSKTEFVIWVPLTELQRKAYNIFVEESRSGDVGMRLWQWLAIMQLCCNHPDPFSEKLADRAKQAEDTDQPPSVLVRSIKEADLPPTLLVRLKALFDSVPNLKDPRWSHRAVLLNRILDEAKGVGDKVLVFSQSIPTMNYLDHLLKTNGRRYERIDGSSPAANRQALTKAFNSGTSIDILLISTRAGGLGLNMFGANRVVIFDFLFNPSWEDQAVGRAYRLGQTKPVFVYRFVAGGTFEDILFNMTVFKSQLAVRVVDKKNVLRESERKTKQYLFPVRDVAKEDCRPMLGKDPEVLDRIIAGGLCESILKVTLSRIQDDENDRLTDEESRHVDDQLALERLKRSDPSAYNTEMERRRIEAVARQREEDRLRSQRFSQAVMNDRHLMLLHTIRSNENQSHGTQAERESQQQLGLNLPQVLANSQHGSTQTQLDLMQHMGVLNPPPPSAHMPPLPTTSNFLTSGAIAPVEWSLPLTLPSTNPALPQNPTPASQRALLPAPPKPTAAAETSINSQVEWTNTTPHDLTLSGSSTDGAAETQTTVDITGSSPSPDPVQDHSRSNESGSAPTNINENAPTAPSSEMRGT